MALPQPTGRNRGGYFGEPIDIDAVQRELCAVAAEHGWQIDSFLSTADRELRVLHRSSPNPTKRIYLSTGIHGDEPAGPLAVVELLRQDDWPADAELWICPCLNPTGFGHNTRENFEGLDLNRDYRLGETAEVRAHLDLLNRLPRFDLTICLHEDWEAGGFYVYELNPDQQRSLAEPMIAAVSALCPIDPAAEIDGRPATAGIIRPDLDPNSRLDWPEAFYLIQHKSRLSYTLESPSDLALPVRVGTLVTAVQEMLSAFRSG